MHEASQCGAQGESGDEGGSGDEQHDKANGASEEQSLPRAHIIYPEVVSYIVYESSLLTRKKSRQGPNGNCKGRTPQPPQSHAGDALARINGCLFTT